MVPAQDMIKAMLWFVAGAAFASTGLFLVAAVVIGAYLAFLVSVVLLYIWEEYLVPNL